MAADHHHGDREDHTAKHGILRDDALSPLLRGSRAEWPPGGLLLGDARAHRDVVPALSGVSHKRNLAEVSGLDEA